MLAAARALIGVPFRLHGRSAEIGVDCVGLVVLALRGAGHAIGAPPSYSLRTGAGLPVSVCMRRAGLREALGALPGDIILARLSPIQIHMMVGSGDGPVVHAHAGLGRVVEMPFPREWTVMSRWRPASDIRE